MLYDCFHNKLACIYEESFPVQEKSYKVFKNKYKRWITTAILNSVKEKNKLYKKYMQTKTIESKLIYRNYKNKLTTIIRLSQKKYYADKFDSLKGNIKGTWKIINIILNENS